MTTVVENRRKGLQFDWTLNFGNLVALTLLILTLAHYGSEAVSYMRDISMKTNIMWNKFVVDNPGAQQLFDENR